MNPQGTPTEDHWLTREYWMKDDFSDEIRNHLRFHMIIMVAGQQFYM